MFGIEQKVARTAKRAGLLSGGLFACTIGAGFLTAAGWLALYPLIGALNTTLVMAGVYLGIGLIMIGVGMQRSSHDTAEPVAQSHERPANAPPIIEAFMYGLQAGARADRSRR